MENEHFSVSRVTNLYIILIVNSPGRSSIKFYTGKVCPGSNYLQIRYSFRIPFHSSLMVEGPSGLLQAFYPQGVLKKVLYGEALLQGPCPYLSTYHFWQKRYSSRIPFHPFWRLRGGVACYRHFKISSDNTRVNGKKDCLIKIKLARYFANSFLSNKIVLTLRNL